MSRAYLKAAVARSAFLALCWWSITEGAREALAMGVLAVTLAVTLSLRIYPPQGMSLRGLVRFIPLFLWRSLTGALDVARRAITPSMPLQPMLVEYRTELPAGAPRVVFANVISLLPGSLCADLEDDVLTLHLLAESAADRRALQRLERTIGRLFP
jgi:multicomponent Na+:H+ antiporter subunit E